MYTVGQVLGVVDDHHSAPAIHYKFYYKGKEYDDFWDISDRKALKENDSFYVRFLPNHPTTSKILLNRPVPDSLEEIPEEGWDELP